MTYNVNDSEKRVNTTDLFNSQNHKITRSQYVKVPETVLGNKKLTSFGVRLVVYLRKIADKYGKIYKTQQQMADDLGVDVRTLKRAMPNVIAMHYLERVRRGVYHLPVLVRNMKYCLLPKNALEHGLQGVELEVLLHLTRKTDKFGRCVTSQTKTSSLISRTRESVNQAVASLQEKNIIYHDRTRRENNSEGICNYKINYPTKFTKAKKSIAKVVRKVAELSEPTVRKLSLISSQLRDIEQTLTGVDKGQFSYTSIYNTKNSRGEKPAKFKYTQKKQQSQKRETDYSDFMARCEPSQQATNQDYNSGQPWQEQNRATTASDNQNQPQGTLKGSITGKLKQVFTKAGIFTPKQHMPENTGFTLDDMWEVNL